MTNGSNGSEVSTAIRCKWYSNIDQRPPANACLTSVAARLAAVYNESGVEAALAFYDELRQSSAADYRFDEWELNSFAYDLLAVGKTDDALAVFKKNAMQYPDASNPYDSLGEIYLQLGDNDKAIQNFKRSLELDPGNTNAAEMLQRLGAS